MAVPVPAIRAKYDSQNHHFIPQIIAVFNIFFCSVYSFFFNLNLYLIFKCIIELKIYVQYVMDK